MGVTTRILVAGPPVSEVEYLGGDLEVAVVVQDSDPVFRGKHRGQQMGDAHRSMPPAPGEPSLGVEGTLPVDVVGR
jgi:hypothetical protein